MRKKKRFPDATPNRDNVQKNDYQQQTPSERHTEREE